MSLKARIHFQPSFHEDLIVTIENEQMSIELSPEIHDLSALENLPKLSVQQYKMLKEYKGLNAEAESRRWKSSRQLNTNVLNFLAVQLEAVVNYKAPDDSSIAIGDGIEVQLEVEIDSKQDARDFHSPEKGTVPFTFLQSILELCFLKFTEEKEVVLLENVESYFRFKQPWYVTSKAPLVIRMYGLLHFSFFDELKAFANDLKEGEPLILDVRNLNAMGTIYYEAFEELMSQHRIVWMVYPNQEYLLKQLNELKVNAKNIRIQS